MFNLQSGTLSNFLNSFDFLIEMIWWSLSLDLLRFRLISSSCFKSKVIGDLFLFGGFGLMWLSASRDLDRVAKPWSSDSSVVWQLRFLSLTFRGLEASSSSESFRMMIFLISFCFRYFSWYSWRVTIGDWRSLSFGGELTFLKRAFLFSVPFLEPSRFLNFALNSSESVGVFF